MIRSVIAVALRPVCEDAAPRIQGVPLNVIPTGEAGVLSNESFSESLS